MEKDLNFVDTGISSDSEAKSYPEMHVSGASSQPVTEVESVHEAVGNAEKTTTE